MTKAQEQIRLHRVDAAATRVIPKSAYWHLKHRPYRGGDANGAENREREEEGVPEILSGRSTQGETHPPGDPVVAYGQDASKRD